MAHTCSSPACPSNSRYNGPPELPPIFSPEAERAAVERAAIERETEQAAIKKALLDIANTALSTLKDLEVNND